MKLIRALLIIICLLAFTEANAQSDQAYSVGVFGGITYTDNTTKIPIFWDSPACGVFRDGSGKGWHTGIAFRYEFVDGLFAIGNAIYEHRSLDLIKEMTMYEVYNTETKSYTSLTEKYSFDSKMDYLLIGVGVNWMPIKAFPVYFAVRLNAGNPMFKADYIVKSEIISPDFALYPNDKKTFPISNGTINDAGTHVTGGLGLGADILLDNGVIIVPEITYNYGLNYVVAKSEWSTNLIRAGVGAFWQFGKPEKPDKMVENIPPPDTTKAVVITEKEIQLASTAIKMSSVIVTETYPLLPYIFFDSASSVLKKKYRFEDDINTFDEKLLPKSTMPIYYRELDIVGKRMINYHNSTITLTGAGDGKEGTPEQRQKLNRDRVQTVADYLVKRWKINPNRIVLKSRDLPELPTGREYPEGNAENRRVEITCKDNRILAPIIHERFLEHSLENRPEINIHTTEQLNEWSIKLKKNTSDIVWEKSGKGDFPKDIIPVLSAEQIQGLGDYSVANQSIECELSYTDHHENSVIKKIRIPVENLKKNYELGRLNLIVFDFDKAEISQVNKDIIRNFVSDAIKPNSKVKVTGSTDYLGEAQYNKKLSVDRAKSVADYITNMVPMIKINSIEGLGEDSSKYDSSLPEGRFYCRTVLTEINTPIKVSK